MAGFGNKVKLTMLKGMEAVGQRASSMASSAQQKLQELNLETQRREILSEFPLRAYDLWQKGEQLPEQLSKMMESLSDLDERLGVLRAQRYAKVEETQAEGEAPVSDSGEETPEESEPAAIDAPQDAPAQTEEAPDGEASNDEASIAAPAPERAEEEPLDEGETGDNA